jgi:hypothetical protein
MNQERQSVSATKAVAEFQTILDHRGVVLDEPIGALAHLGVARAYAMRGNVGKAKTAYQDLFALWKDADLDIPILKRSKAEYARAAMNVLGRFFLRINTGFR